MKNLSLKRSLPLMAACLLMGFTASCGGGGGTSSGQASKTGPVPDPSAPVTIQFASWVGNQPGMKRLYTQFHKKHPNITVDFQNVPAEQSAQKLTTQIAGGNPPAVAYIDASNVATFASRKALVNVDNYIARSDIVDAKDYVPAFKAFTTYNNAMYGLPFDGESTGLFYRKDMFKAAGIDHPPTTWEEFESDAKKLTQPAKKQYGYILFAPEAAYYWYPWLWQAGGELMSKDEKTVEFNSDAAKTAANFYVGLKKYSPPDYLNSNSYDGRVAFANGQVGMYMAGAWFAGTMHDEFPKIDGKWAAAPLPKGKAGCATTIAGDALVMFAKGKQQDAAWKWIEFLSSKESMAEWTYKAEGTLLPPRISLLDSPDLTKEKPVLKSFADAMKCGVVNVASNPKWPQIEEGLTKELGSAMYGDQTPSEAVDKAATDAKKYLTK